MTTDAGLVPVPVDAFAKRRQVARAVARLRADVKASTLPFTEERKALLGELRQVERTLLEPSAEKMRLAIGATVARFDRSLAQFGEYVRDLQAPPADREPVSAKDVLRRKREVGKLAERLTKGIEAAREAVAKSNLPTKERAALKQQMRQQQRAAEKFMGIGLGR